MLKRLYPEPLEDIQIKGLYLSQNKHFPANKVNVYTNFITSVDGRIAVSDDKSAKPGFPNPIANSNDLRLYQELAAISDAIIVSGSSIRAWAKNNNKSAATLPIQGNEAFSDLIDWRLSRQMSRQPAVIIFTKDLNIPELDTVPWLLGRKVLIITEWIKCRRKAKTLQMNGAEIFEINKYSCDSDSKLKCILKNNYFNNIYSVAGPKILKLLIKEKILSTVYLTQALKILGGKNYLSLYEGPLLSNPITLGIRELYLDSGIPDSPSQLFGVYDVIQEH